MLSLKYEVGQSGPHDLSKGFKKLLGSEHPKHVVELKQLLQLGLHSLHSLSSIYDPFAMPH